MKNKYLSFIKNGLITSASMLAVGAATSELARNFTDDGKLIGAISTATSYISSWAVFLPLQAYDNRDVYKMEEGGFDKKRFLKDNIKFGLGLAVLDLAYLFSRPFIQDRFIDSGMKPANSSIAADAIFIPGYFAASIALARLSGVIRKDKSKLEQKLEEKDSPD